MELWQLQQMQALPLEVKILKTQLRVREWYEHWNGQVYVSFSGGKDSTVLLHIVRNLYPDVPAVFSDTGLEFPEIRDFVKATANVTWLRPSMTFRKVIEKHGYPVISKEQASGLSAPGAVIRRSYERSCTASARTARRHASVRRKAGGICSTRRSASALSAAMK